MYNDYKYYLKLTLIILILTLLADAFELDEKFKVSGGGHLYSKTDTLNAQDLLSGYGDQYYHKNIFTRTDVSNFESNYSITRKDLTGKKMSNTTDQTSINNSSIDLSSSSDLQSPSSVYKILFKSPSGLYQSVEVWSIRTGLQNFTANSSIAFEPLETTDQKKSDLTKNSYDLATSIFINGTGDLFEYVANTHNINTKMRPFIISESSANSLFEMRSSLKESITLPGSETAELSSEADKPLEQESEAQKSGSGDRGSKTAEQGDKSSKSSETNDGTELYITLSDLEYLLVHKEISKNEYLSDLDVLLKSGRIDENGYIAHINKMRNQQLILLDNIEYDNLVKDAKISQMTYDQLLQGLETKTISASEYLSILRTWRESNRINNVEYLSGIYKLKQQNIITDTDYSAYKQNVFDQLLNSVIYNKMTSSEFRSIIMELKDKKLISETEYNDQGGRIVREMIYIKKDFIKSGDLSEIEYLEMVCDALKNKAINQTEYERLKEEVLRQLKDDYVENRRGERLTWNIYKMSLNDMLNRSIINTTEYDEQLHEASMSNLEKLDDLIYDDDSIPKDDSFVDTFLSILDTTYYDHGYISSNEYVEFLISINNTQLSEKSRNLIRSKLEGVVK